jgi:hypothetical protein
LDIFRGKRLLDTSPRQRFAEEGPVTVVSNHFSSGIKKDYSGYCIQLNHISGGARFVKKTETRNAVTGLWEISTISASENEIRLFKEAVAESAKTDPRITKVLSCTPGLQL